MKMTHKAGWGAAVLSAMAGTGALAQEGGFALGDVEVAEEKPFYTSEIEVGLGYSSEDSFKFGEYNGLEENGAYIIGNFNILRRGAYDGDDLGWYRLRGRNLGLENRFLKGEYGQQGRYKVFALYDKIPHNQIGDGVTVYDGVGSDHLRRPAGWGVHNDVTAMPVSAFAKKLEIANTRENLGLGGEYQIDSNWSVDLKAQREERDGTKLTAGIFGTNGGNPAAVLIPEPIDYTTDRVDAGVNYTDRKMQFRVAYSGSFFRNENSALRWDSLFTGGQPGGGPWGDPVPETGQLDLPPDSQAHYFNLSGGYNVSPKTRLHGQVRYSIFLQDDDFLPYTINPDLVSPVLPRSSLDGELRELLVDLAADSRITSRFSVRGTVRYRDSENDTPRDVYTVVHNDTSNSAGLGTGDARVNLPYEFRQTKLGLEGTYRFGMMTRLKGGYRYEQIDRNLQEVEETEEHAGFARLSSAISPNVQGWLEYTHAERTADDDYSTSRPFIEGHTAAYLAGLTPGCTDPAASPSCENHPALRKFHLADRDRDDITGVVNWFGESGLSIGFRATYREDDYDAELGLTEQQTQRFSIEPAYQVGKSIAYAYVTYEQLEYDQRGHEFPGFGAAQNFTDPTQRWSVETTDKITTFGLGVTRKKIFNNVDLEVEYTYSDAKTEMEVANGGASVFTLPAADLPDLDSRLHRVSLSLDYAHKDNLSYRFRYVFEDYSTEDFAQDSVGLAAFDDVLGIGASSPDYSAHAFGVSMAYKFQ